MEKIYYDELLNHIVIKKLFLKTSVLFLISLILLTELFQSGKYGKIIIIVIVGSIIIASIRRYMEKYKIKKLFIFYNNSIKKNNFQLANDDLKNKFISISEYIILNKLEIICEPKFVYNNEITVYTAENTQTIIVNGYFKDVSFRRDIKRKYTMIFVDKEYYMCCIDKLICWQSEDYWSRFYKEGALKNDKIDYINGRK